MIKHMGLEIISILMVLLIKGVERRISSMAKELKLDLMELNIMGFMSLVKSMERGNFIELIILFMKVNFRIII